MSNTAKWELQPEQKADVIKFHHAARCAYGRYLESTKDVESAACFWTAWHCTKTLALHAPLIRCAVALGINPISLMDSIIEYHELEKREPERCAKGQEQLEDFCLQLAPE
ncbi:MAG: hypothetical protein H6858_04055 [Rhodospirillales bacterium]|nr:hypothetical protein [Alphaproteobacteria bacterium]MCB9976760.1 hypothetical protein [Rhodospirillales bacterium]